MKYLMVEMIEEAGVHVFLHCWGVDAILQGSGNGSRNAVAGAVFESKSGRQAILAKNVVDATGDGDVFASAGAEHEHRRYHAGLVHRIGNLLLMSGHIPQLPDGTCLHPGRLGAEVTVEITRATLERLLNR